MSSLQQKVSDLTVGDLVTLSKTVDFANEIAKQGGFELWLRTPKMDFYREDGVALAVVRDASFGNEEK
eukprot:3047602-Alexandrium_andersonii.AAC.1